jgi:hypothetical protein
MILRWLAVIATLAIAAWEHVRFATVTGSSDPLVRLVLSSNFAIGPMPVTGGTIPAIDAPTAALVSLLLRAGAKKRGADLALLAAWACQESRFAPTAFNPNHQDAKPGETAAEAFGHADIGFAQFDGSTLLGMPQFAGKSIDEIKATAEDPNWSVPTFCDYTADLLAWGRAACGGDASLLAGCGGDPRRLSIEAYNVGRTGAKSIAQSGAYDASRWAYANAILARAAAYDPLLTA